MHVTICYRLRAAVLHVFQLGIPYVDLVLILSSLSLYAETI